MSITYGDLTIHYRAGRFAAEGAPQSPKTAPKVNPAILTDETSAAVALVFAADEDHPNRWAIIDSQGNVLAESPNPGHLADWLQEYAETLGDMHCRGEL
jgi:hypothetical protein